MKRAGQSAWKTETGAAPTRAEGVIYALRHGIPHLAIAVVLGVGIGASAAWCPAGS